MFVFYLNLDQFAELICRMRPQHWREAGILNKVCHHESLYHETRAFFFLLLLLIFLAVVGWYNFCAQISN